MSFSGKKKKIFSDAATTATLEFYRKFERIVCFNVCGTTTYRWLF